MTRNPFHRSVTLKVAPRLKPIKYDPWAELEFKHQLTGAKMKEKQALVLYDTGLMKGLKERLEKGSISLREDVYWDYLRYGDIRRSYLCESIECGNLQLGQVL